MMGGTRELAKAEQAIRTIITEKSVDPQASLPEGTLKGPFLDRQGDEQREPSEAEKQKLKSLPDYALFSATPGGQKIT
jgi:hypothetical protein